MDTRLMLQIALGVIITLIVVMGTWMIIVLTQDAETVIVESPVEDEAEEEESPWADLGEVAIDLVKGQAVESEPGVGEQGRSWTLEELMESDEFIDEGLGLGQAQRKGWEAQWWDETRFGPSFYRVRYTMVDEGVELGPTWVVDVDSQAREVAPKNVWAQVAMDPEGADDMDYFDQTDQVVAAIANHRFPTGLNLGGAILLYFEGDEARADDVLGWTVNHHYGEIFEAYFQWREGETLRYGRFEFDYDDRALRPANLLANEIMGVGEAFEAMDRVSIMPGMYDPDVLRPDQRWQGAARRQCRQEAHRDGCEALATILDQGELVETLEWLMTTEADRARDFEACQEAVQCRWLPSRDDGDRYRVSYAYNLNWEDYEDDEAAQEAAERISWIVDLDSGEVSAEDDLAELALRAVESRL